MTKNLTMKRTLLGSVLSLALCLMMFAGSTYAWFTDSAETNVSSIRTGTLGIDLVNANGESVVGQTLGFKKADGAESEAVLWEPGCTYVLPEVYAKNSGELALKYQIKLNGVEGDSKLLEVIDWVVKVGDQEVALDSYEGNLAAGETSSEAIVLEGHMREEAGNDYQNLILEGISISVVATQDTVESDSFDNQYDADAVYPVESVEELQEAIDNAVDGDIIQFASDFEGDVTITNKPGVEFIIDGNGKTLDGVILVDGKSATYTTAGVTINNLNFVADSISADACIQLGDGTTATRYTCNVTVNGCTFDVPGAVGVKSYTGGDKNVVIKNCVATENAHSLVQLKGVDGVLIENCEVYSKNGLNFNNSDNVTVVGCTVDTKGYAVRFGESSGGSGAAETYLIKDCSLKSANDDGDATIILRGTADNSTLTIQNTTIVGTPDIANTATGATVIK